jgi:hypothetical protein
VTANRMSLDEFVSAVSPFLVPSIATYSSVFLLLVLVARQVDPAEFGAAAAAAFLSVVALSFPSAIQAAVATGVWPAGASRDLGPERAVAAVLRRMTGAGAAWIGAVAAASAVAAGLLRLPILPLMLLVPAVAFSLLGAVRLGLAHAAAGPRPALLSALAAAVVDVLAGATFIQLGIGAVDAVLLALVVAEAVAVALAFGANRFVRTTPRPAADRFFLGGSFRGIFLAILGLTLISIADVLLARFHLDPGSAGRYASAAVLTRALLFLPPLATILSLPKLGALPVGDPFRWLRRTLVVLGGAILVAWMLVALARVPLTSFVLGGAFEGAADLLPALGASAGLLALLWYLSLFHKTVRSRAHSANFVSVVVFVVACAMMPVSRDMVAALMLAVVGAAGLFQYQGARAICRWSPPLSLLSPHEEVVSTPSLERTDVELSVILPCRNGGPVVRQFLRDLIGQLEALTSFEVIIVSDGSTDETVEIASEFASPTVRVLHYEQRLGKGHAIRVGLHRARGQYVGYIDSDGDIDPAAIGPFLSLMKLYELDIVLGSKRHPMSEVKYPPIRRIMSWTYHKVARLLFMINVRDTQTGFKVIRREVVGAVLPRMLEKRYAFDLELLVIARLLGYRKVFEAPVRIDYQFSSQVVPSAALRILVDTAAIFYRRFILNTYSYAGDRLVVASADDEVRDVVREVGA